MTDYAELIARGDYIATGPGVFVSKAEWQDAMWQAFPDLLDALKAVMAERDDVLHREAATTYRYDAKIEAARAEAAALRARVAEQVSKPSEPGGFVGDIYFGHPVKTTMGTHRWNGDEWEALPSELEATLVLLAAARARVAGLKYEINEASDPDFLFGAMDNVADMGVTLTDYAEAASRAIRAALSAKAKDGDHD